ncbi:hypothetical protein BC567DRAFT_72087 [Phyllosticta citribraziliensis]
MVWAWLTWSSGSVWMSGRHFSSCFPPSLFFSVKRQRRCRGFSSSLSTFVVDAPCPSPLAWLGPSPCPGGDAGLTAYRHTSLRHDAAFAVFSTWVRRAFHTLHIQLRGKFLRRWLSCSVVDVVGGVVWCGFLVHC